MTGSELAGHRLLEVLVAFYALTLGVLGTFVMQVWVLVKFVRRGREDFIHR
jgi:Tfp pilus assembly protein PilV